MLADRGRSGEAQLADDRRGEQVARNLIGHAEHRLRDFLGQAGIVQALQHADRRGRRLFGRFHDDRAACRYRRAELAAGVAEREIPRAEGRDRADRLIGHGRAEARRAHQRAAVDAMRFARIEIEQADIHHQLDLRLGEGLALFHRRDAREIVGTLHYQPRRAREHRRALLRGGIAPDPEAFLRRLQRAIEIGGIGQRQFAQCLAGRGIDHIEGAAVAGCGDTLAVDDHAEFGIIGHAGPFRPGSCTVHVAYDS
jgi:hypothetical protein